MNKNTQAGFAPVIVVLLVLAVGGSVSWAAENTLPGDALYAIKTHVNENVRGWLAVSDEAKANWEAEVSLRRLDEAEKLAMQAKLSTDVEDQLETNFQDFATRVSDRVTMLEDKNPEAAARVSSQFESSLMAHERILANIGRSKDEDTKIEADALSGAAGYEANAMAELRAESEAKISAGPQTDSKTAAEGMLGAAQNKIDEVQRFIDLKKATLGVTATAQAELRLKVAQNEVTQGKASMDAGKYNQAFVLFLQAHRVAQESQLLIEAKNEFENNSQLKPNESESESPRPSSGASPTPHVSPIPQASVRANGEVRIDLGL